MQALSNFIAHEKNNHVDQNRDDKIFSHPDNLDSLTDKTFIKNILFYFDDLSFKHMRAQKCEEKNSFLISSTEIYTLTGI